MAASPSRWEQLTGWARRAAAAALSGGGRRPIPRHVAFIMDGNRRYAEAHCLRKAEGHAFGYARLLAALEWCLELGVACVSVYAFSIDNYRRSGEEVGMLMSLAQDKLAHLLQKCAALERHGVRVRVVGDLSLAPLGVRAAAAAVEAATAHHSRATLNLCFSYTASEELQRALDSLAAQQQPQQPFSSSCGSSSASSSCSGGGIEALEQQLYTAGCPPVDLLVRTSGETRLSDFLLWQSRHALLVFTEVLWPEFGFLDLVAAVQQYQRAYPHLQRLRAAAAAQAAAAVAAVAAAEGALAAAGGMVAVQQQQHLPPPVKLPAGQQQQRQRGSPCSIASPASPSSPSSRSGSEGPEDAGAAAIVTVPHGAAVQGPRQRHAASSAVGVAECGFARASIP